MTTGRAMFATDTIDLLREQIRHGFINAAGLHATRDAVADQVDDRRDYLAADAIWLLDQLDAEIAIRRLDPGP